MDHAKHGKKAPMKTGQHKMPDGSKMPGKSHDDYMEKLMPMKKGKK